jgi:hydrogenase maturation protein HypF
MPEVLEGRLIELRGTVQGVGFRPWVYRLAREEGISGRVRNDAQGVTIEAFGGERALAAFLRRLSESSPPAARIESISAREIPPEPGRDFAIVASRGTAARRVSIPPDLATCPECLREVTSPGDRRYLYPFTNCTSCGPRFTIARSVPYDRTRTSMASFPMCAECAREYASPEDRRFHAQPNACPVCGPHLRLLVPSGAVLLAPPLATAAAALREGAVLALKGLGGYHLACDATSSAAVTRLRARKRRERKPLAVMAADLADAERVAVLGDAERRLIGGVERPIVLLDRRPGSGLAPEIAPGSSLVGLLLPYTALHHLLLAEVGRPLVMTSGNVSDEPIAHEDEAALSRLGRIADFFLVHDRAIENRCDDSVARVIAGRPVVLRRARGHVPRAITLARPLARPVLACGAHLKNTFCLASRGQAWLGPHVGDLQTFESCRAFEESVARFERFLGVAPEVIAHDLHPDYFTTRYARARAEATKIGVQHHHAHVASAMAEHRLTGPVIGVAYDGSGYGTDTAGWGGEILVAGFEGFERVATFRPLRLAGGDLALREVWRLALALLDDAFDGDPPLDRLALFGGIPRSRRSVVRRLLAAGLNAPKAHGVGRYFDALGAIVLAQPVSHFEGEVALAWNLAADAGERRSYPFEIASPEPGRPVELDLRPLVRAAVADLLQGRPAGAISGRFHATLAAATAELVRLAVASAGRLPVVLTGGCFQNARLAEDTCEALAPLAVHLHGEVPPGDGGIALGQALVADALVRSGRCA